MVVSLCINEVEKELSYTYQVRFPYLDGAFLGFASVWMVLFTLPGLDSSGSTSHDESNLLCIKYSNESLKHKMAVGTNSYVSLTS